MFMTMQTLEDAVFDERVCEKIKEYIEVNKIKEPFSPSVIVDSIDDMSPALRVLDNFFGEKGRNVSRQFGVDCVKRALAVDYSIKNHIEVVEGYLDGRISLKTLKSVRKNAVSSASRYSAEYGCLVKKDTFEAVAAVAYASYAEYCASFCFNSSFLSAGVIAHTAALKISYAQHGDAFVRKQKKEFEETFKKEQEWQRKRLKELIEEMA